MIILAHHPESINLPDDRAAYRAFVAGLDEWTRALLFRVSAQSTRFRCPSNGRIYTDEAPRRIGSTLWTRCQWCDTCGRLAGESGYRADEPQPHAYIITEADHE